MSWISTGDAHLGWQAAVYQENFLQDTPDDKTSQKPQLPITTWLNKQLYVLVSSEIALPALSGSLLAAVSKLAYKISHIPVFQVVFIASITYAVTAIVRRVFEDYSFCRNCEYMAVKVSNAVYGLRPFSLVVASIFLTSIPSLSISLSIGLGVLQGLTNEINFVEQLTSMRRAPNCN